MEPSDALSAAAQIAATLTGFTGVVAVFGSGAVHEWPEADRFRLQLLLTASIVPLVLSLLGLLLLTTDVQPSVIWSACSGVAAALFVATGIRNLRTFRKIGPQLDVARGSSLIFILTSSVGIATCLLQIFNMVVWRAFWPFFTVIVAGMLIALVQFVRLILLQPMSRS